MTKIEYSPMALEDLKSIREYITDNWGDDVAERIMKNILVDILRLEQYPLLGISLEKIIDISTEYRYLFSEKNYIIYRIKYDRIQIIRIINERQNYIGRLFGHRSKFDDESDIKNY